MTIDTTAAQLSDAILGQSGPTLVLTGAGVSLASGIPTFRGSDPGAVWSTDVMELATQRFFQKDPVRSWQWYRQRFARAVSARPNPAHIALAGLERWHADSHREFLLVTQNIDTLHEQAGSNRLIKIHGSADRVRCSNDRCPRSSSETLPYSTLDFTRFEEDPRREHVPGCDTCGSPMRPHVLWFDELYTSHRDYQWFRLADACGRMRLVIAVGTSFSVGVTEAIRTAARELSVPMFVVDPGESGPGDDGHAVHVRERAEDLLPAVCARLG